MSPPTLEGDLRRPYRDLEALPCVVGSYANVHNGTATFSLELASGVDRVPPTVCRKAAEHDFGVRDVNRIDGAVVADLVADVGGGGY